MNEYSESWHHLKALLAGYTRRNLEARAASYEEQRHAKALSIFLTNADLATPRLNREIVDSVLAGRLQWPRTGGEPYNGTDIPLSRFEELGLVSFFAGWCATHADSLRDVADIDPTLIPVIKSIEHLKDIRWGRNGCIQPHYACGENELKKLLQNEFGDLLSVGQLLPELELDGDMYRLKPGNENFSAEISTQLWNDLRRNYAAEEAFSCWVRCFCVNCDWVMPVIFDERQWDERREFDDLMLKFLAEDPALAMSIDCYVRQSINEYNFSGCIRPTQTHVKINIDLNSEKSESDISEKKLPLPTLSSLEEIYPAPLSEASSALDFVTSLYDSRLRECGNFYGGLVSSAVEASIRIEIAHLGSSGLVEKLINLASLNRPILKYLLYVILPNYDLPNYMTLLLARKETSDVAFFHLSKRSFARARDQDTAYLKSLRDAYQQLLCREYIQAIQNEPDFSSRFIAILKVLGEQCAFHSPEFYNGFEYRFLLTLLDSLTDQQVSKLAQAFSELSVEVKRFNHEQTRQHFSYLLGFWLIERMERIGLDNTESICDGVRQSLRARYKAEFLANFKDLRSLESSSFFGALSWKQLFTGVGQDFMLALSSSCDEWTQKFAYENRGESGVVSAVGNYLQILISAGQASPETSTQQAIATRVQEIIRLCGFKNREEYFTLFDRGGVHEFDLWEQVCSYSNSFTDELYRDFIVRCGASVPLNLLFALLEQTSVIARQQLVHEAIDKRSADSHNELGLHAMEDVFTSAINSGRTQIASQILLAAKKILAEDRFAKATNKNFIRTRKIWQSYEYKSQLLELYEAHRQDPIAFEKLAINLPIPHDRYSSQFKLDERGHYNDCNHFRRQLIATAFCETDPAKTVRFLKQLYMETNKRNHGFVLLYGHLKLFATDQNKPKLRSALTVFLACMGDEQPNRMNEYWVATILEVYQLSGAAGIDNFWAQLSPEQQGRRLIFTPYCRMLLDRRDSFTVKKILARYREVNHATLDKLEIDDLISELAKIERDAPSMQDFLQIMAENSQRTVVQLQKHYNQIIAQDFEAYVEIIKPDQEPHEYIKDAILGVARELVLRKRNLQVAYEDKSGDVSFSGLKLEDWVNDWFVSLFDQRMSHAKISLRDQKRGGHSVSGKGPGEIDGFITSSNSTRVGIFEGFRLSSVNTTTIAEHLNKIAGYDGESLSPVVMVGYCDARNFPNLVDGYQSYVLSQSYKGYTAVEGTPKVLEKLYDVDHIWLGRETRSRGRKDVIFYHLLINLHFSVPVV